MKKPPFTAMSFRFPDMDTFRDEYIINEKVTQVTFATVGKPFYTIISNS